MSEERWLPIPGWEGYYSVSDQGRIRGENRIVRKSNGVLQPVAGRLLTLTVCNPRTRHRNVKLTKNGQSRTPFVHKVVLAAFVGPCPPGLCGLHWDDDPANNILSNLRYGTHTENSKDNVRNGNHVQARKTHCPANHEYTPANTLVSCGKRRCRACIHAQADAANARRRQKWSAARAVA